MVCVFASLNWHFTFTYLIITFQSYYRCGWHNRIILSHYMSERCPVVYCLTVARWGLQQWVSHGLADFFGCCCCHCCAWWPLTPAMRGPRNSPHQVTFSPVHSRFIHTNVTLAVSSWPGKLFFNCVNCNERLEWERINHERILDPT